MIRYEMSQQLYELIEFINTNNISKSQIINIIRDSYWYLIYKE